MNPRSWPSMRAAEDTSIEVCAGMDRSLALCSATCETTMKNPEVPQPNSDKAVTVAAFCHSLLPRSCFAQDCRVESKMCCASGATPSSHEPTHNEGKTLLQKIDDTRCAAARHAEPTLQAARSPSERWRVWFAKLRRDPDWQTSTSLAIYGQS